MEKWLTHRAHNPEIVGLNPTCASKQLITSKMNVEKKIVKFQERLVKAEPGVEVKIVKFKRKHFNDQLGNSMGFSYSDLKPEPREFFKWLINEDIEFTTTPTNTNPNNFGVVLKTVKPSSVV